MYMYIYMYTYICLSEADSKISELLLPKTGRYIVFS